jgi:hypothetical protein
MEVHMGAWRVVRGRRAVALALLLVFAAGCSGSTATWPALHSSPTATGPAASGADRRAVTPSGVKSAAPEQTGPGGAATPASATVNNITVEYTYQADLMTPFSQLYGKILPHFVVATITNDNAQAVKVKMTSGIAGFTNTSVSTVTVAGKKTATVEQDPELTSAAIDSLTSQKPGQLEVLVTYLDNVQDRTVLDETDSVVVTGRSDFPWSIKGMTEAETFELLGVMVTPTDPAVKNDLIRAAANYDPSRAMISGYQSEGDADNSVYQRLDDIWQAETNDFALTYISTPVSFAPGDTQAIRLPSEALSSASGNCIELALLYASAVEAMGMQPVIVVIPGHAYLGVRVDDTSNSYYFVETTMIGQATFDEAVTEGGNEWDEAMPHENNNDEGYGWVEVSQARSDGILPIPWH